MNPNTLHINYTIFYCPIHSQMFTKDILHRLSKFPHVFTNGGSRLEKLSRQINIIKQQIINNVSNYVFSGNKKIIYVLDHHFKHLLNIREEDYQSVANILMEILVSELEKIFTDSNISAETKTTVDIYDVVTQHNIIVIDWE